MKKLFFLLALFLLSFNLTVQSVTIDNPSYEVKNTGIDNIVKIELGKNETRVHVYCTFIPGWWVKFEKTDFIQDSETGQRYYPIAVEGTEFDKETFMSRNGNGDSLFVLIFPPIDKKIKKIDYGTNNKVQIWGISLDKKQQKKPKAEIIPADVEKWLEEELKKNKTYTHNSFFRRDTAYLRGYIKGYDPRLKFETGIVYMENVLTNEDYPIVIEIHPDGRFEADLPMIHPVCKYAAINQRYLDFYAEPGKVTEMVIDWNEFLKADRYRNIRYKIKAEYRGELSGINNELQHSPIKEYPWYEFNTDYKTLAPDTFCTKMENRLTEDQKDLKSYIEQNHISDKSQKLLWNDLLLNYAYRMFNYADYRRYEAREDSTNSIVKIPLPETYYNFLKKIPMSDQSILISTDFSSFINHFEYCSAFSAVNKPHIQQFKIEKTFLQYLKENKIPLTKEEKEWFEWNELLSQNAISVEPNELSFKMKKGKPIDEKFQEHMNTWRNQYIIVTGISKKGFMQKQWESKDSVLINQLDLAPSFAYEVTKVRSLHYTLSRWMDTKEDARDYLTELEKNITTPFLIEESERVYMQIYPDIKKEAYKLPEGKGTDIFRKIIDSFKGKALFVDFWGIYCGPCVSGIKEMKSFREKYQGNPYFDFIFITDESSSPLDRYNTFVEEQNLIHTYRLTKDDYNYLRQLFKFNGIPRYVLIDKQGLVLNDNYNSCELRNNIENLIPELINE